MKGVQDALRRLYGVTDVRVDLQTNQVLVIPAPDAELDLAAIPAAIRRAGFTPAEMELEARGAFAERDGASVFRIRGWARELPLRSGSPPPRGAATLRAQVEFEGGGLVLVPVQP